MARNQNWKKLPKSDYQVLWDKIFDHFHFAPYSKEKLQFNNLPNQRYDLSHLANQAVKPEDYEDFHDKISAALIKVTSPSEKFYALNWQHDGFEFDPREPFEVDEFGDWFVSPFPNGDIVLFINTYFSEGFLSDGWDLGIILFGKKMVENPRVELPRIML